MEHLVGLGQVQAVRGSTGGEQQLLVADHPSVGLDGAGPRIDAVHGGLQANGGAGVLGRVHPVVVDREIGVGPQHLRQRGPGVGAVRVGPEDQDAAVGVHLADPAGGAVGGHAAATIA